MGKMASQIRLDEDTFGKIKHIAEKELRTMNAQMEYFLLKGIKEYERACGPIYLPYDSNIESEE